jgi:hypothetical protein
MGGTVATALDATAGPPWAETPPSAPGATAATTNNGRPDTRRRPAAVNVMVFIMIFIIFNVITKSFGGGAPSAAGTLSCRGQGLGRCV